MNKKIKSVVLEAGFPFVKEHGVDVTMKDLELVREKTLFGDERWRHASFPGGVFFQTEVIAGLAEEGKFFKVKYEEPEKTEQIEMVLSVKYDRIPVYPGVINSEDVKLSVNVIKDCLRSREVSVNHRLNVEVTEIDLNKRVSNEYTKMNSVVMCELEELRGIHDYFTDEALKLRLNINELEAENERLKKKKISESFVTSLQDDLIKQINNNVEATKRVAELEREISEMVSEMNEKGIYTEQDLRIFYATCKGVFDPMDFEKVKEDFLRTKQALNLNK